MPTIVVLLASVIVMTLVLLDEGRANQTRTPLPPPAERLVLDLPGDPRRPVKLRVPVVFPPGSGPFPLAIWNHGSNGSGGTMDENTVSQNMGVYYLLSRGYAVAMPLMRGFGNSGDGIHNTGCRLDDLGRDAAADVLAVIDPLAKQHKIDASRIVVAGSSFGGWNALAIGTFRDARIAAIINFYGGVHSSACRDHQKPLIESSRRFGQSSRVPSLWLYGSNDQIFPKPLWQAMYRAYTEQGGRADIVDFGQFRTDSHKLLGDPSATELFAGPVDRFLAGLGLPGKKINYEYLPSEPPPATHYAAIIGAVPFLNARGQEIYKKFLSAPSPKALVIAPKSLMVAEYGGFDPLARAMAACQKNGATCWPYAVNDIVVWAHPTPSPPPTHFARLEDTAAVPYVDAAGKTAYGRFLTAPRPRAFVIGPDGSWSMAVGERDPVAAALATCGDPKRVTCQPYAVDGTIVWPASEAAAH
jgi:dienelactone hydrolase